MYPNFSKDHIKASSKAIKHPNTNNIFPVRFYAFIYFLLGSFEGLDRAHRPQRVAHLGEAPCPGYLYTGGQVHRGPSPRESCSVVHLHGGAPKRD